jgi:hypothetical protein
MGELPVFFIVWRGGLRRSRFWLALSFLTVMLFWLTDARAQTIDLAQSPPTLELGEVGTRAMSRANDITARLDSASLPLPPPVDLTVPIDVLPEGRPNAAETSATTYSGTALGSSPKPRFQTRTALRQEFEYLMVEHSFRAAMDPSLRYSLSHAPFFHDWFVSFKGYDLKRWSDGDDFLVTYIAHPMQGAIASDIFLQNSPVGSTRVIGKDPQYWTSRLKGMAWAAAFEVQWKIGPISETSLGNAGGWEYVPGCGFQPVCESNPSYPPPTNNTGLQDWIVSPTIGTGWVMLEDTIDKYLVKTVGARNRLAGNILRSSLEPCRNFAALFAGVLPWTQEAREGYFAYYKPVPASLVKKDTSWKINRRSIGVQIVNISLPGFRSNCIGCRENHVGIGLPYGARIFKHVYFDSDINFFSGGSSKGNPSFEGLFGAKVGTQGKTWGFFAKVRPGLIYYQNAWSGGESAHFTDLSRFALDAGGVLELYPSKHSTIRFDFGTTLVRYLQDFPNPRISPIGSIISTDYYVTQGNYQFSTGYRIRF